MFKDFDEPKPQLGELSEVVGKFSSDAVQLRIIELLFGIAKHEAPQSGKSDLSLPV